MAEEPIGEAKVTVRIESDVAERRLEELMERRRRTKAREDREEERGRGRQKETRSRGRERGGGPGGVIAGVSAAGGRTMAAVRAARSMLVGAGLLELAQMVSSTVAGAADAHESVEFKFTPEGIKEWVLSQIREKIGQAFNELASGIGEAEVFARAGFSTLPQAAAYFRGQTILRGEFPEEQVLGLVEEIFKTELAQQRLKESVQALGREAVGRAVAETAYQAIYRRSDGG